jgi:hypothetical protein
MSVGRGVCEYLGTGLQMGAIGTQVSFVYDLCCHANVIFVQVKVGK